MGRTWNNSSQSAGGSESRDSDNDNDRDEDVFEPMFTFAEVPVNTDFEELLSTFLINGTQRS